MNSKPPLATRVVTWAFIAVGMLLILRLVYLFSLSWFPDPPVPLEHSRAILKAGAEIERKEWERAWIESGAPPPPGGFDATWKRARQFEPQDTFPTTDSAAPGTAD